jgi:phytoene dehydrogenase-like protein
MRSSASHPIVIIGAGLAGLACARKLMDAHKPFVILEASDAVGGRVRTDIVDGFRLDRGFQVFLPAYPEAQKILDYDALDLRPFYRGAMVHWAGKLNRVADPLYHPTDAFKSLNDPVVPWRDKWFALLLRKHVFGLKRVPRDVAETTTAEFLHSFGFSEVFIDRFMRPFFGGVFMDKELITSSRMFQFIFAMFDRAGTAVPAAGMQAIPEQLADPLPAGSIRYNQRVATIRTGEITLDSGDVLQAKHIVVAVCESNAYKLIPGAFAKSPPPMRASTCRYFVTDKPIPSDRCLFLDGDLRGPVNHACVISNVAPTYSPSGQHLISASVLGTPSSAELESVVREQLTRWFGPAVDSWRHLRTYQIRDAQSEMRQRSVGPESLQICIGNGLYRCGDYCEDVSINGALLSGRKTAEAVLEALS